jgi:hypothetical protein
MIGNAEVEMGGVPEVEDELLWERFIKAIEGLQPPDIFGSLLVADIKWAPRRGMHDQKREPGHHEDGRDEPEDPVQCESHHAGFGLLTGVLADRESDEPPDVQATQPERVSADAVAIRLPISSARPNSVVKVVSVHLMIEHRDHSIAQFYVSRTSRLNSVSAWTFG